MLLLTNLRYFLSGKLNSSARPSLLTHFDNINELLLPSPATLFFSEATLQSFNNVKLIVRKRNHNARAKYANQQRENFVKIKRSICKIFLNPYKIVLKVSDKNSNY